MTKPVRTFLCLMLLGAQFLAACQKNKSETPPDVDPPNAGVPVALSGTVIDEEGKPIAGAIVKSDGQQATSSGTGSFSLQNVKTGEGNMLVVESSKTGYGKQIRRVAGGSGKATLTIAMTARPAAPITFEANAGGNAELLGGAKVSIPADAVVRADGSRLHGRRTAPRCAYRPRRA